MAPLSQKKRAHTYHRHKLGIKHLMRTHGLCSYTWMLVYAVFIYVDACVSCTCARTGCVHICGCLCMLYMCTHGLCSYMLYMCTHGLCSYTWMPVYAVHVHARVVFIYVDACVCCVHIRGCLCMLCSYTWMPVYAVHLHSRVVLIYVDACVCCVHIRGCLCMLCSYTWMPVYAVHVHTCCIHACLPILYIALVSLSLLLPSAPARTQKAPLCPANKKCVLYLLPILLRSILLPFFEPPSSQLHAHL